MYNFRMLNRRPLELPALDTLVPMVEVEYRPFTAPQARGKLKRMPNLLYNKYSGWHFFLSNEGIGKMTNEHYVYTNTLSTVHLSAVANIDALVRNAILGYSKLEPAERINSAGKKVRGNNRIKTNHRFYVGAWIDHKPYSVRMMIREYIDGTVELGEEAKAYALNIKEMRGIATGQSEFPAPHGVTTALDYAPLIKDDMPGISMSSSRCEPAPPTDIPLTGTKIAKVERRAKRNKNFVWDNGGSDQRKLVFCWANPTHQRKNIFSLNSAETYPIFMSGEDANKIPLHRLIDSNLKEGEESLYQQRATFDYSKTGTDSLETLFDRMGLRAEQRTALYNGDRIVVSGVRLHSQKTDIILYLEHGELTCRPYKP